MLITRQQFHNFSDQVRFRLLKVLASSPCDCKTFPHTPYPKMYRLAIVNCPWCRMVMELMGMWGKYSTGKLN